MLYQITDSNRKPQEPEYERTHLDAADANEFREVDITDPMYRLRFLFLGESSAPGPFDASETDVTPGDPRSWTLALRPKGRPMSQIHKLPDRKRLRT